MSVGEDELSAPVAARTHHQILRRLWPHLTFDVCLIGHAARLWGPAASWTSREALRGLATEDPWSPVRSGNTESAQDVNFGQGGAIFA
jgi:hypothetical protein